MILQYKVQGNGPTVVCLHGMAGSGRYWNKFLPYIIKQYRVITMDLLGFGQSPKPKNIAYDYKVQIESIRQTLGHIGVSEPFIMMGHSMGGLIALRYARIYPGHVSKLLLIAMPIYRNPDQARQAIVNKSKLKELAYYGWTSRVLCNVWCSLLRPISRRLAPIYLPAHTREAATDSVLHTWQSYSESLHNIIEKQTVYEDINHVDISISLVYGDKDMPKYLVEKFLNKKSVTIHILDGDHQVLNQQPLKIANMLTAK